MTRISSRFLCQIYVLLLLLTTITLSPLPYSVLALLWLLVRLFSIWRPLPPKLNMATSVATLFLVPLLLAPVLNYLTYPAGWSLKVAPVAAVIPILPAIYLLDSNLRQNAEKSGPMRSERPAKRLITTTTRTLFVSALTMLFFSLSLTNFTLLFTSIVLILYLLVVLIRVFLAIPQPPLEFPALRKRVIAGALVDIPVTVTSKASTKLYSLLSPVDPWVKVTPQRFALDRGNAELNFTVTPPLAGPSHPQLQLSVLDPWGLIQVNQLLAPVELHVIPRARYAEWLALRYLEQTGTAAIAVTTPLPKAFQLPKRGTEYFDSRNYQPGDSLKNIDWKHTLKLNRLIVKEYIEAGGLAAILAVNLSVTDHETADKLAFDLITAALTLTQEAVPTSLAVYDHQRVVLTTTVIDPREMLKRTLSLVKDITLTELTQRFLQLPDHTALRRDIKQLKQATSEPAQRLLNMLNFEYQALERAARSHPATLALALTTEHTPAPAIIVLVSQLNHDAEALPITTEKLTRRGFTTLYLERSKEVSPRKLPVSLD